MVYVRVTEDHGIDGRVPSVSVEVMDVGKNSKRDESLPVSRGEKGLREELASQSEAHSKVQ